ncbi:ATPase [Parashewanella spongiae]|uniref:ATPase n=1 Tax=Parashewanella spongiae TaxID=342950 RepID=A0A3A6T7J1_9GAMM|nr:BadF/BadG/BcrA/BcrD ATPase family protein [Parashewanella spongiae]MCL1079460.1 ATPase [Parashewanella spongiae]RJY07628.1 ATPase [Parashewanella spongiae]
MEQDSNQQRPLFIGIDGGGSKCRAAIYDADNRKLGEGIAGRANPLFGVEQTFSAIHQATEKALVDSNLPLDMQKSLIAGVGIAGVNVPALFDKVAQWRHPFSEMYLTTDLHIACAGAHLGGNGAVIITGTGSCGFAQVDERQLTLGGYGFALGDKGSGGWYGLKAAEYVLLSLDGFKPHTQLTEKLLHHYSVDNALGIVENLAGKPSSNFAELAAYVFICAKNQDKAAIEILKEGANYISDLARKLLAIRTTRFSIIGGLAEPLLPWLDDDIANQVQPALASPEVGAIYFAQQQMQKKLVG